jgi:putative acyl-CoA dehydrogenase
LQRLLLSEDKFLALPASEALARAIGGAEPVRYSTGEFIDGGMVTRLGASPARGFHV